MNFTLLITVLVTALTLVVAAYVVAKLIGPRSYAKVKGEPYESGIPTRGSSWLPVSVGFYLFAILFLMFDIETVFLYPWAVVVKEFGAAALLSIGFFLVVLVLGLAYAWRKGDLEWKEESPTSRVFPTRSGMTTPRWRRLLTSSMRVASM